MQNRVRRVLILPFAVLLAFSFGCWFLRMQSDVSPLQLPSDLAPCTASRNFSPMPFGDVYIAIESVAPIREL